MGRVRMTSSISHLSVHEEAQRERDSHGPVSKLLFAAHGSGGGGVVGGGVGGLCRWETHEGFRGHRGVWSFSRTPQRTLWRTRRGTLWRALEL